MPWTVLIADDDAQLCDSLAMGLRHELPRSGTIHTATSIDEAVRLLDAAPQDRPLFVLSDYNFREARTGVTILERAARHALSTRWLMSGENEEEIASKTEGLALDGLFLKPFVFTTVAREIARRLPIQ